LRIQLKPRALTPAYIEAVRESTAYGEIHGYLAGTENGSDFYSHRTHGTTTHAVLARSQDVCEDMFAHRAKKLERNRISRVKGWPFRLHKHKIVSCMKIFNDWRQRTDDNAFFWSATDL
jgi:hypothetical protein